LYDVAFVWLLLLPNEAVVLDPELEFATLPDIPDE